LIHFYKRYHARPLTAMTGLRLRLTVSLLSVWLSLAGCLRCACNDKSLCHSDYCDTDGQCRKWIKKLSDDTIKTGFQCIPLDKLFPPERPFACQNSKAARHRFLLQCCDGSDYCNSNISLSFQGDTGQGVSSVTEDGLEVTETDQRTIYLIITVLASTLVILATGCCVYIVRLSRRAGYGGYNLPCLSTYTEVETKSSDAFSTTTIQVRVIRVVLRFNIYSCSGPTDDHLLGVRIRATAAAAADSGQTDSAAGVHRQGQVWRGQEGRLAGQ